jgi:hypothetical protein
MSLLKIAPCKDNLILIQNSLNITWIGDMINPSLIFLSSKTIGLDTAHQINRAFCSIKGSCISKYRNSLGKPDLMVFFVSWKQGNRQKFQNEVHYLGRRGQKYVPLAQ